LDGDGVPGAVAIQPGGKGELSKSNLVWQNRRSLPYVPTMLSRGEYVYFVNDKGVAYCVEAATGKSMWEERLGAGMSASPILVNDKIYAAMEDGDVYVFAAEPTYKLLAKNSLGEPMSATPAVANHRLYLHTKTHLYCIGNR
jgi:outer membrane protein assembly factor BamB